MTKRMISEMRELAHDETPFWHSPATIPGWNPELPPGYKVRILGSMRDTGKGGLLYRYSGEVYTDPSEGKAPPAPGVGPHGQHVASTRTYSTLDSAMRAVERLAAEVADEVDQAEPEPDTIGAASGIAKCHHCGQRIRRSDNEWGWEHVITGEAMCRGRLSS